MWYFTSFSFTKANLLVILYFQARKMVARCFLSPCMLLLSIHWKVNAYDQDMPQ